MAGHSRINWLDELLEGLAANPGLSPTAAAPARAASPTLFGMSNTPAAPNFLASLLASNAFAGDAGPCRTRSDWNDRLAHWERPESVSETGTIERAKANVGAAIAGNAWLGAQRVQVLGQGSYFNRTNVRLDADIDLRVVHPLLKVISHANVHRPSADRILGYSDGGLTFDQIFTALRANLVQDLAARFGRPNVEPGKKAIRIKGITGCRAEVDVVPAIRLRHITWLNDANRYHTLEGIALLSTDGRWTFNFPDQHSANGRAKRARTGHQFKRMVRIFKRIQLDMFKNGIIAARIPSFLIECLVYCVDDWHFQVPGDDRYGRTQRIACQIGNLLTDRIAAGGLCEINEAKWLFHDSQSWTYEEAVGFSDAVMAYLGNL